MFRSVFCIAVVAAIAHLCAAAVPNARLTVAADNTAALYINGVQLSKTFDWQGFVQYDITVREGDVIAIDAEDLGAEWGVIAALKVKGKRACSTMVHRGPWKAIDFAQVGASDDWKNKGYDASSWPVPGAASIIPPAPGSAPGFPYKRTKAQYVWAQGLGGNSRIALRLDVTAKCV